MTSVFVHRRSMCPLISRPASPTRVPHIHVRLRPETQTRALPKAAPTLSLVAVALLWSTYGPTMRVIFADPGINNSESKGFVGVDAVLLLRTIGPSTTFKLHRDVTQDRRHQSCYLQSKPSLVQPHLLG